MQAGWEQIKERFNGEGAFIKKASFDEHVFNNVLDHVRNYISTHHRELFGKAIMNPKRQDMLRQVVASFLQERKMSVPGLGRSEAVKRLVDEIAGVGPLAPLFEDDSITDIMVNGPNEVYIKVDGRDKLVPEIRFRDEAHLQSVARKILNASEEQVTEAEPIVDARLPATRINVVIPPVSRNGTAISIRKFPKINMSETELVESGMLNSEMMEFLQVLVKGGANIITCGATGSGKTTLVRKLAEFIPDEERIVTIEDTEELWLKDHYPNKNVVSMECRTTERESTNITMSRLVRNALRQQPDRIIVGEVRGPEAFDMIEAMNTGHSGSITTLHANSTRDAIKRLVQMILRAGLRLSAEMIWQLVMDTVNIIIYQERMLDGKRRILQISEVTPDEIRDIYKFDVHRIDRNSCIGTHRRIEGAYISDNLAERLFKNGIPEHQLAKWTKGIEKVGVFSP